VLEIVSSVYIKTYAKLNQIRAFKSLAFHR